MPGLTVVPQWMVDALGPAISLDENMGRVIAEQFLRTDDGAKIVVALCQEEEGTKVAGRAAALPPLRPGATWDNVADALRAKAKEL